MSAPYPTALERFPRLRQSLLSDADNCMLSANFSLEHERGFSTHPAARGQIVHRTIAKSLELLEEEDVGPEGHDVARDRGRVPVDVALEVFEEVLRQADMPMHSDGGDQVACIPVREIAQARIDVKTLFAHQRFTVSEFAGIEWRLDSFLRYPDGEDGFVERVVTGRPDLLLIDKTGQSAIVVDWKSTWGIPSEGRYVDPWDPEEEEPYPPDEGQISEEGYFQQRFYAMLVFHRYPAVQSVTLREFYLRYASGKAIDKRTNRPVNPVREATVHRHVLPEIEMEMAALVERFDRAQETGHFTPSPGSHCYNCVLPNRCPIFPPARGIGMIESAEQAEVYAGRLQVTRARTRKITRALRAWSNRYGNIHVKDAKRPRVYGPVVRSRTVRPSRRQVEEAIRRRKDPRELYRTRDYVTFCVHTPEEEHPYAEAARLEEEMLLAAEKAERKR